MKYLMVVMLGLVMFAAGTSYAGDEKAKCSVKKAADCSARKKYMPEEQAKRFEKTAANYEKKAAKLKAAGKTAAATALKKKADAKRMMAKAVAGGDKKMLKKARVAFAAANKEYKATDCYKEEKKKRDAKKKSKMR